MRAPLYGVISYVLSLQLKSVEQDVEVDLQTEECLL